MHTLALILLAGAGLAFLWAALCRWRHLGSDSAKQSRPQLWIVYLGFIAVSCALLLALIFRMDTSLTYAALGSWSAVASLLFLSRFLTTPSLSLLGLPIGATLLVVAMSAGLFGDTVYEGEGSHPIVWVHALFMVIYLGAILVTGATAGLYVLAARQLKSASSRALRLPSLPELYTVTYRGLVVTAAMLLGGIATGGAAWSSGDWTVLIRPAPLLSLCSMVVVTVALGLYALGYLGRRGVAMFALILCVLAMATTVGLVVNAHG